MYERTDEPRTNRLLTLDRALWAYAEMMNTLDADRLAALLAYEFHYASQSVFAESTSR